MFNVLIYIYIYLIYRVPLSGIAISKVLYINNIKGIECYIIFFH